MVALIFTPNLLLLNFANFLSSGINSSRSKLKLIECRPSQRSGSCVIAAQLPCLHSPVTFDPRPCTAASLRQILYLLNSHRHLPAQQECVRSLQCSLQKIFLHYSPPLGRRRGTAAASGPTPVGCAALLLLLSLATFFFLLPFSHYSAAACQKPLIFSPSTPPGTATEIARLPFYLSGRSVRIPPSRPTRSWLRNVPRLSLSPRTPSPPSYHLLPLLQPLSFSSLTRPPPPPLPPTRPSPRGWRAPGRGEKTSQRMPKLTEKKKGSGPRAQRVAVEMGSHVAKLDLLTLSPLLRFIISLSLSVFCLRRVDFSTLPRCGAP